MLKEGTRNAAGHEVYGAGACVDDTLLVAQQWTLRSGHWFLLQSCRIIIPLNGGVKGHGQSEREPDWPFSSEIQ